MTDLLRKPPRLVLPIIACVLLAAALVAVVYLLIGGGTKSGTAYFASVKSVYPGDAIRILGVKVGEIDSITPEGNRVRVQFHYDGKYDVPADAKAAIVSPTLVATRFIQLEPAYTGGAKLADNAVIPLERTVSPLEFDQLKEQLSQLADALGPNGVNADGALNRALKVIDANGRGQGENFNRMITELAKAAKTFSDGRGDLFGTVRNLAGFSSVLAAMDQQIIEFDHQLADVTGILNDNDQQLREMLPAIDSAATLGTKFLNEHTDRITETVDKAGSVVRNLAQQRDNLANILHVGPNALTNFLNIYNPRIGSVMGNLVVDDLAGAGGPGDYICTAITNTAPGDQLSNQDNCVKYLGPLFQYMRMSAPPVGVNVVPTVPGGGHYPRGGDPAHSAGGPPRPESGESRMPPTLKPPNSGGLLDLMQGGNR